MNILILTGNGREHALALAYAKSKKVKNVIMIPGNGLSDVNPLIGSEPSGKIKNYPDINVWDFKKILQICKKEKIDFIDVSQDDILAAGYVDRFQKEGFKTFGPTQKAAQIEWDKAWAREFMKKYTLPIPVYETFTNEKEAIAYVNKQQEQTLFIKAAGLAGGKGVIKAENKKQSLEAIASMKQFGASGKTFVVEHELTGEEFSLFALCDGKNYKIVGTAQDHKTVYNKNVGLNTGGMGSIANPTNITKKVIKEIEEKILKPFIHGMEKENRPYSGILYLGCMLGTHSVSIIEFNARWGDPEAQVLLPAILTDYLDIVESVQNKKLSKLQITIDTKKRISVVACSFGYPKDYSLVKGKEIFGIIEAMKEKDITIYGAGIEKKGKRFFANGGRLFHIVAQGKTLQEARKKAYSILSTLYIEGNNIHYRTDIGWQEVEREIKN